MADKDSETGRFLPGNSGFGGRPKGARNKLGEEFLKALYDDFKANGVQAVKDVRADKPDQYLKVIASLLPREMTLNVNNTDDMTDDEIIARLKELHDIVEPFVAGGIPRANGSMDKAREIKTIN